MIAPLVLLLAAPLDTLVVGTLADPVTLRPHRATDLVGEAIVSNVCETLVRFREGGSRPEPGLATTWASLDSLTWTFTLRPDVRFHDGTPLDADAVLANLESLRRERRFAGAAHRAGPLVVTLTLARPNAAFLATLSQPFFGLQSPRGLERDLDRPVGTGPFRVASIRPGRVELRRNADHWGGPPRLEAVVFRRFADADALLAALRGGAADVTSVVGHERLARLRELPELALESKTGLNLAFLALNNERTPFTDRRVRQAIARAVDRDALLARLLDGHGEPARNPLPPAFWGYAGRTRGLLLDRPGARRLLAEAGLAGGFDATLLAVDSPRPYLPTPLRLAAWLRDDLAQVGIRARLETVASWSEYVERAKRGAYDMIVLGWQADTTDPNDFLTALLSGEAVGDTNRSRYRSLEMDALLERGRMGRDPDARIATYREIQELFQRDMPFVPLYHASAFVAYRKGVNGLAAGPTGLLRFDKAWKTPP